MTARHAHPKVLPLLVERWSPRSFVAEPIPNEDLHVIFEGAALAPSAFNLQPWTFLYAQRGDANWDLFLSLLVPFNAGWAKDASALVFIVSDTLQKRGDQPAPLYSHSFDAGAAWACMALQATALGYHVHGMTGIDFDRAVTELRIPADYRLEAAVAIGRIGSPDALPDGLREREFPSGRRPLAETVRPGRFA